MCIRDRDNIFFGLLPYLLGTFDKIIGIPVAHKAVLWSQVIIYCSVPKRLSVSFVYCNPLVTEIYFNFRLAVKQGCLLSNKTVRNTVIMLILGKADIVVLQYRSDIPTL